MLVFDCKYGVNCKNYEDISKCKKCVYIDDGLSQFEPDKEDSISHDAVLCAGWRSIKEDITYKKEPRVLIFSNDYPENSEMRIRIIDAQFVHLLTDATHWKKLDEPTGI